jgi:hypothetical protein
MRNVLLGTTPSQEGAHMANVLFIVLLILTGLWKLAGLLMIVTAVLALLGVLTWWSPVQWLIITLVLAAARLGVAALVDKATEDANGDY